MFYGSKKRRLPRVLRQTDIKKKPLKDLVLEALTLADLKKLQKLRETFDLKVAAHRLEVSRVDVSNAVIRQRNDAAQLAVAASVTRQNDWDRKYLAPLEAQIAAIQTQLRECRVGMLEAMFGSSVSDGAQRYRRRPGVELLARRHALRAKIEEFMKARPSLQGPPHLAASTAQPKPPKHEKNVKVAGTTTEIDLSRIDSARLRELLERHYAKIQEEKNHLTQLKARAAISEEETRKQARRLRRSELQKQLEKVPICPYCSGPLDELSAHRDHIYPVAKGGKSTLGNLVFVCVKCNAYKKTMTLRSFLVLLELDHAVVHTHLEVLKKDF